MEKFLKDFANQLLDQDTAGLTENVKFRDLDDWDSLTAMAVIAMIKDEYGVEINTGDFKNQVTIGDLYNFIQSNK